eukprot:4966092-Amphidinium_carterae.1
MPPATHERQQDNLNRLSSSNQQTGNSMVVAALLWCKSPTTLLGRRATTDYYIRPFASKISSRSSWVGVAAIKSA